MITCKLVINFKLSFKKNIMHNKQSKYDFHQIFMKHLGKDEVVELQTRCNHLTCCMLTHL